MNVVDDFSLVNPSITMGEMTLQGEQAIDFVRNRKDVSDQTNLTRMERQKEYMDNFLKAFHQRENEDINFSVKMYEEVSPYIVTDCSAETLSDMLSNYLEYTIGDVVIPEGENILSDGHYEFHVDEEKLDHLIMELFYTPK